MWLTEQYEGAGGNLVKCLQELQLGEPKYELMSPQMADVTRQQLPQLKAAIAKFEALQSVSFKGVGQGGMDIYEVKFENATTEWRIMLGPDGKTLGLRFN